MFGSLYNAYSNEHWFYNLLSFNYTNVLDRFVSYVKDSTGEILGDVMVGRSQKHLIGKVVHVHQSLEDPIICGVDDVDQIAYEPFRHERVVQETLVKKESQRYQRRDDDEQGFALIAQAKIICIYGMSLGVTDRRWWKAIIERMAVDDEVVFVIMSYDLCEATPHTAFAKRELVEAERARIFDAAEVEDQSQKDDLVERIIVMPSTAMLVIQSKIERNLRG